MIQNSTYALHSSSSCIILHSYFLVHIPHVIPNINRNFVSNIYDLFMDLSHFTGQEDCSRVLRLSPSTHFLDASALGLCVRWHHRPLRQNQETIQTWQKGINLELDYWSNQTYYNVFIKSSTQICKWKIIGTCQAISWKGTNLFTQEPAKLLHSVTAFHHICRSIWTISKLKLHIPCTWDHVKLLGVSKPSWPSQNISMHSFLPKMWNFVLDRMLFLWYTTWMQLFVYHC